MTSPPERRENLSETKRALLEKRLQGRSGPQGVLRRPANEPAPLSFAQERLWFLYQLHPSSTAYNMHEALRLHGALNVQALETSLNAVIAHHDILRTTFVTVDRQLVQKVSESLSVRIDLIDLQNLADDVREAEAQRLATAAAQRRFNLAQLPLLQVQLVRLDAEDHLLLLTLHHIISDEWSNGIFWRELAALYEAYSRGESAALDDLALQYADFAYWQRKSVTDVAIQRQLEFWKTQLGGDLPLLQLPTDHPRPAAQSYRGAWQAITLPLQTAKALRDMSQRSGTTLFMTLLAAFKALLFRYTGQVDSLVGIPIANRSQPEIQRLIGFFLNTLVIRTDLSGNPRFSELLEQVQQVALAAYAHQDLPFEKLVDELRPTRDLSHNPLFQVMFVYQDASSTAPRLPGLSIRPVPVDGGVSKFDLTLFTVDSPDGLQVAFEYSTDLFDVATIERMLGHFKTLVDGIIDNPEQRLSELPLLSAAEWQQLVVEWGGQAQDFPQTALIHDLFEEWAAKTPDAPALVSGEQSLTYAELNARANQLAHHLRALGMKPGVFVGLCVERSVEMLVGILGILKTGAAYVPLDPDYPRERLAFVLEDTAATVILTQQRLKNLLPVENAHTICLDSDWPLIAQQPTKNSAALAKSDDLAYVIYTSGSTGRPKGVPITHRNLVHSTTARFTFYPQPVERFLLMSSFAFDSSIVGIFWSICQGGSLCLPYQKQEQDVQAIADLIERWRITHLLCLPSLYNLLLEYADAGQLTSLNTVMVAGEACMADLVKRHYRSLPHTTLYNEYGPTEGTVWSTAYAIPSDFQRRIVPIGHPIPNMQNFILDPQHNPVPIGVIGELYIGGEGLTNGYLHRPELTAERFITHPFSDVPDARLYRTGDLARYLADGNIEFLGRADHQVKVRGYRIELEEIEVAAIRHPAVKEVVVVTLTDQDDAVGDAQTKPDTLVAQMRALDAALAGQLLAEIEALEEEAIDMIFEGTVVPPEGS